MRNTFFLFLALLTCMTSNAQTNSRVIAFAIYGEDTTIAPNDTGGYIYSHGRGGEIQSDSYSFEDDYPFVFNPPVDLETGYNGVTKFDSAWDVSSAGAYYSLQSIDSNDNITWFSYQRLTTGIESYYVSHTFNYDHENNLLLQIDSDLTDGTVYPADKNIYTYNTSNSVTSQAYQVWNDTTLQNSYQGLYYYSPEGTIDSLFETGWDPGPGSNVSVYSNSIFHYTDNIPDTLILLSYDNRYALQGYLFEAFYFSTANDTMIIDYYDESGFSSGLPTFEHVTRVTNTYDTHHNKLSSTRIAIVPIVNSYTEKTEWTYNEFNQVTSRKFYSSDSAGNWILQQLARFYYETYETEVAYSINNMDVFPSPAQNNITIKLEWDKSQPFSVAIFDAAGRRAMQWSVPAAQQYEQTINLPYLASGNYFVRAVSGNQQLVKQFVLLH